MPSTYAHYRFGHELAKRCPAAAERYIREHRALYDIGLHGPDILFYYKPLGTNPVNAIGFGMHARPAREFFGPAPKRIAAGDEDAARAYLLGFLCHFSLDSACHSYIENKIRLSGVTHTEIESEFDRSLLLQDGKDPLSARLTAHILPTRENARVIAPLFQIKSARVRKALRGMLFYNRLLRAPHAPKRALVNLVLHLSGNYREMHGMMIAKRPIPACEDSNMRLRKLFDRAVSACAALMEEYLAYLDGTACLPAALNATFSHARGWRSVPVLSPQEEQNFEP